MAPRVRFRVAFSSIRARFCFSSSVASSSADMAHSSCGATNPCNTRERSDSFLLRLNAMLRALLRYSPLFVSDA